jgi:hypothetical protein
LYDELGIVAEDAPVDEFTTLGRIHYKAASDGKWGEHESTWQLLIFLSGSLISSSFAALACCSSCTVSFVIFTQH